MAELAVGAALVLAEVLLPYFLEQLDLKKDVIDDIESMKTWLRSTKAFIEDNDGRRGGSLLATKVDQVRDLAYEIEDVLEEFFLHSSYVFHNHKITQKVYKYAHNIKHGFPLGSISEKITTIRRKIDDIKSQNAAFSNHGNFDLDPGTSSGSHRVSPLLLDDEMVGYEEEKREFSRHLVGGEKELLRLAVAGPTGSGKTTFVKNVFWKPRIRGNFDCHAWLHVSRNFNAKELFVNMLQQFSGSGSGFHVADLSDTVDKLRKYLTRKRYFLVLDDIWRDEDWRLIEAALPNGSRGSRIVVTTSNMAFICASSQNFAYNLNGLQWPDAWRLFCRKAFHDGCPSELKECSIRIVKLCEGLPFAIVAVGSALSQRRKLPAEWERFHDSIANEIGTDSRLSVIGKTLLPGYRDLSSNLKSCFLYFSIFPEDYSVERGRLVRLWAAEQFAIGTERKTAEEVAEDYLNELIHRNLVHVSKWDFDGRPRSCRVLNLVHKFIIHKCKEENFASIICEENTSPSRKIRRLALHNNCIHLSENNNFAGVRSMFLFRCDNVSDCDLGNYFDSTQLLRVLDLQCAPLTQFPQQISQLVIIRYICLRDTNVNSIPSSIKKLLFLETLDLKQTEVTELPKEISRLRKLRHLFAYKYNVKPYVDSDSVRGVKTPMGISNLTNLQDLSLVKVGKKGGIIKELRELTQLRKLGLLGLKREHYVELRESISHLEKLSTLDLSSSSKEEFLDLEEMRSPPRSLQRLYLKGRMGTIPRWISSLDNLLRIGLKWSKMVASPLQVLGKLPNLIEVQLVDCFVGGELVFETSSFKKLKILLIEDFSRLHTVKIEQGSMPELKQMFLRRCPKLKMLPLGIDQLVKIEELILHDMAEEFIALLRKRSEDRWMVRHIPLLHSFKSSNNNYSWSCENFSESFLNMESASPDVASTSRA